MVTLQDAERQRGNEIKMIPEYVKFREKLGEALEIDDWQAVDIIMAAALSHKLNRVEMCWWRIIGASGSGKTELLRALGQLGCSGKMGSITPAAIRGGFRKPRSQRLLAALDGKLIVTKEFATLLTVRKDKRVELFGLLREVHDGEVVSDFGSEEGHLEQRTRFDWIIATTQYFEEERRLEQQLGTRFIDILWGKPRGVVEVVTKAINNDSGELDRWREELAGAVQVVYNSAECVDAVIYEWLPALAAFTAAFRTPLKRDRASRVVMEMPIVEAPTRVAQALSRLACGLRMLGIEDVRRYLVRVALDCLPPTRAAIVKAMIAGETKGKDYAVHANVSETAITHTLNDMDALARQEYPGEKGFGHRIFAVLSEAYYWT